MLWNPHIVSIKDFHVSSQSIHAIIMKNNFEDWLHSAVYASPSYRLRNYLWETLRTVAEGYNIPWLVAGDFNDHARDSEKKSFTVSSSQNRNSRFLDNINSCNLVDLRCNGLRLT